MGPYSAVLCFTLTVSAQTWSNSTVLILFSCCCCLSFSEFSGLQSLTVFIFTADYGKTCRGRGHIVSPRAQLVIVKSMSITVQSSSPSSSPYISSVPITMAFITIKNGIKTVMLLKSGDAESRSKIMGLQELPETARMDCFADMARQYVPRRRAGVREGPLAELGPCPFCLHCSVWLFRLDAQQR